MAVAEWRLITVAFRLKCVATYKQSLQALPYSHKTYSVWRDLRLLKRISYVEDQTLAW